MRTLLALVFVVSWRPESGTWRFVWGFQPVGGQWQAVTDLVLTRAK